MATTNMDTVIRHLRRVMFRQDGAGWTDGQLLASFIDHKDEAAFEALFRRHGPMVFGVCRRLLPNHHDAEDAFQATFLVLVRKAPSVRPRERVANWLHGVALRTALKAKAMTAKRRRREKQVTEMPEPEAAPQDQWRDLQPLLDRELNGLPERYRLPILLCDLEGKTIKDAAQQLGWPQGSLAGRLARGRKLLAKRLANRGVALSAGSLAVVVSQTAVSAGVPTSLMNSTVKAATMIAAGQAAVAGVVPAQVATLTEGVMKAMLLTKLKTAVAVPLVMALALGGGGGLLYQTQAAGQPKAQPDDQTPKAETTSLVGTWKSVSLDVDGKQDDEIKEARKNDNRFPDGRDHEFGKVKYGASLKHAFRIVNTSDVPLRVIAVRSSCGCMSAVVTKPLLQPDEKAVLNVRVDTRRFVGQKAMSLFLETEQRGTTETFKFRITANSIR